ncbi:MAG: Nre family DNA repair protein [Candidatus Aenigmatarchaeota archaeon]
MLIKHQSWENPRCEILKTIAKLKPMGKSLCLTCKGGRLLCGRSSCPLLQKLQIQNPIQDKLKETLFGPSPPSIFVGWKNYPNVFAGPMGTVGIENISESLDDSSKINSQVLDNPAQWYGLDFNDIIRMRSMLIRSKKEQGVREKTKLLADMQELTLSTRATDIEMQFKSKPHYSMSFSPISQPMGPSAVLEKFRIAENTKIPQAVDSIISDKLKAVESSNLLYQKGFDVYYISKVLSAGILGLEKNRKLVPTKWSITTTDTILANEMLKQIRTYPQVNEFLVFSNTYLENHFEVLMIPGSWGFEQFEAWAPKTIWTLSSDSSVIAAESEGFHGRSDYAITEGGGYYAGRFACCEKLEQMRRQATVVVFREIYDTYVIPVGSWEIRENLRHAFMNPPMRFSTLSEALNHIASTLKLPIKEFIDKSKFLRQRKLFDFL